MRVTGGYGNCLVTVWPYAVACVMLDLSEYYVIFNYKMSNLRVCTAGLLS